MLFKPWWEFWKSWLATLRRVPKRLALGDIRRWLEERRLRRPARSWIKQVHLQLEVLEERRLFAGNVYLPGQIVPTDGSTQANIAVQLLRPATASLMPSKGLQSTTVASAAQASFSDTGGYSLSLLQAGAYDNNGDRYTFQASGNVTFSLTEQGSLNNSGFTVSNMTLSETGKLTWSMTETNSSGQTVQALSGNATFVATNNGAQPMDGFFPGGFDWYYEMLAVSNANNLGLNNLAADTVSVQETNGSENYELQETGGIATVQGNVRQPLSSVLDQTGQQSYQDTAVEQFSDTEEGADSFILSELGTAAGNGQYNFTNVNYQETGSNTHVFNATVSDSQSGTVTGSGAQSFSGNNHSLGASAAQTYNFTSQSTSVYGETATSNFTLTESGSYGNGAFNLNSLVYQNDGSGSSALTQTSAQTQTGNFNGSGNASGTDSFGVAGSLGDSGTATNAGNFTATSNSTLIDNESGNFTLTEQGAYANGSWALSSFNLSESLSGSVSQQQLGTTTQAGNGTATDSGAATDSYALGYASTNTTSATDTTNSTDTTVNSFSLSAVSSATSSGSSSYTLSELGSTAGGVVTLTAFVFSSGQSGTWSSTGQSNQTVTGTGNQTASGSNVGNQTSAWLGVSASAMSNGSSASTDCFTFTSTDSYSSSDSGAWGQATYQSGNYGNGSWSLSSVSLSSNWSDSWSSQDVQSSTDTGTDSATATGTTMNSSSDPSGGNFNSSGAGGIWSRSSNDTFADVSVHMVTESGSSAATFSEQGNFGGYSFAFSSVVYQNSGSVNDTFQDGWTGTSSGTVVNASSQTVNLTANSTFNYLSAGSTQTTVLSSQGTYNALETATSVSTTTAADAWSLAEQGAFTGGSWGLSSVNYQESYTGTFANAQTDQSSDAGTDSYSSLGTATGLSSSAAGGGSIYAQGTLASASSGTDSYTDSYSQTLTQSGVGTWSTSQLGSFGAESFAFASVVYQGGQSFSQTYTSAETHSSVGTANDSSTASGNAQVNGSVPGQAGSNLDCVTNTTTDQFLTSGSSVYGETDTATDVSTYYQAGCFVLGSFALSSVTSTETYSALYCYQGSDTQVQGGPQTQTVNESGFTLTMVAGFQERGTYTQAGTITGSAADTSLDSYSGSGAQTWTSQQAGSFANFSYGYGTVLYQESDASTSTYSSAEYDAMSGTATESQTSFGTASNLANVGVGSVNGQATVSTGNLVTLTANQQGTYTSTDVGTDTSSLYEEGSYGYGSYSLGSVNYAESYSESWSSSATDASTMASNQSYVANGTSVSNLSTSYAGGNQTTGGLSTLVGGQTLTNGQTITSGDTVTQSGGSSWSLTELGVYANWSYSLSSIVSQGVQTAGGTLQQNNAMTVGSTFTAGANQSQGGSDGSGQGLMGASSAMTVAALGTDGLSAVNSTGDSLTDTGSSTYQWYQSGSYAGGSVAYGLVNQTVSASDSWTLVEGTSGTQTSSLSGTTTQSMSSANTMSLGSNSNTGSTTQSTSAVATVVEVTGQSGLATLAGGDSYVQYSSGSYVNGSWSYGCWSYQGTDSFSSNSRQTSTMNETLTASGTTTNGSGSTDTSGLWWTAGLVTVSDGNSSSNTNTFAGTVVASDTTTSTQAGTYVESFYESGVMSGGSFSMSSMAYDVVSTSSSTSASTDGRTTTDTMSVTQNETVSHTGAVVVDVGSGWNAGTFNQLDTITSGTATTTTSVTTYALHEEGSFGGESWSLSSYALLEQAVITMVQSQETTINSLQSGSYAGQRTFGGVMFYNVSGTFLDGESGHPVSLMTAVMVYNLVEQGVYGNFSFSLPCFSYGQQQSSVASSTDSTSGVNTFAGVDTAGGQSASYSGVQTSSGSSADTSSSAASLSEAGNYSEGSFTLSAVSYSGSGNDSYSAQDSSVSSWSGSYSGGDSSSDVAGGSASWSSGASGCFASGSFGLSSYSLQGGGNGSSSSGESWQGNDNGSAESYAVGQSSQETDNLAQAGMQASGNYYNSGYSYTDSAVSTATSAASAPTYSSADTWAEQNSEQLGLSGSANQTSSAQYAYQDGSGGGGNLNNASTATPNVSPPGAVAQMAAPDASLVPNNGADQAAGGGANTGGVGGDAPVPGAVAVAVGVTTNNTGQWLTTTEQDSWGSVVPFEKGSHGEAPLSGNIFGWSYDVVSGRSKAASILALPQAPKAPSSFRAQAWTAMQPLFQLLSTWSPQEVGAQKSQVRALLQISLPQPSGGGATSSDPLVNFVDRALYNNGQPLTAGSAPMYGTYWTGMGLSAQGALAQAAPYVSAGIHIVAGMWMVGPSALGATMAVGAGGVVNWSMLAPSAFAFGQGGIMAVAAASAGGSSASIAEAFGTGFYDGAKTGSQVALGGLLNQAASLGGTSFAGRAQMAGALNRAGYPSPGGRWNCFVAGTGAWFRLGRGGGMLRVPGAVLPAEWLVGGWGRGGWRAAASALLLLGGAGGWWLLRAERQGPRREGLALAAGDGKAGKGPPEGAGEAAGGPPDPPRDGELVRAALSPQREEKAMKVQASEAVPPQGKKVRRGGRLRRALSWCSLLCGVLLAGWLQVGGDPGSGWWASSQCSVEAPLASVPGPLAGGVQKRAIETARLGWRAVGRNPLREQVEVVEEPNPATWREIHLEMRKGNGRRLFAELLRTLRWLEEQQARVGGRVWLDLPEMGVEGWATVTGIGPCPEIVPGEGSVVTGLFRHEPDDNLVDVRVEGLRDPIGCTDNHPFWSEDRGEFVAAGKLRQGERLRVGELGELASVMSVTPRPREAWVYNLEVQGEHVYQVSEAAVLVHNSYGGKASKGMSESDRFPTRDAAGKLHTHGSKLPKRVPRDLKPGEIRDAIEEVRGSLAARRAEQAARQPSPEDILRGRLENDPPWRRGHDQRIVEEERWLRQLEERLRELER